MIPAGVKTRLTHEKIYKAFLEAVDDLVYVVDREGRYAMFNERGLAACGFRQSDVVGKRPSEAFGPEMGRPFERNNEQVLATGKPLGMQEWIAIRGVSRCFSTSLNPVLGRGGRVEGVIGISRDVSDLKRMVEQLQIGTEHATTLFRQRVHYEHLVKEIVKDSMTRHAIGDFLESVVITLGEGLGVSRSYFFQYDHERQVASNVHEWTAPGVGPTRGMLQNVPISAQPWWSREMLAGRIICLEDASSAPSPELVDLMSRTGVKSVLSIPLFVFGKPYGFIGFDQCDAQRRWDEIDVELLNSVARIAAQKIERHRLEQDMLGTERLAAMGRLTSVFAHEINNPLQGILLHLESLEDQVKEGGMRPLSYVKEGFERISSIISRLSLVSSPKMKKEQVDLNDLLRRAYDLVSRQADMKGLSVRWFLDKSLPVVCADGERLHQALLNVIINAIDSMERGGQLLFMTSVSESGAAEIEIRDNGCGIEEQDLPYLFEPFFTTKGSTGTGLGLFVSHSIVAEHGGTIEVSSKKGEGTNVFIRLPAVSKKPPASG